MNKLLLFSFCCISLLFSCNFDGDLKKNITNQVKDAVYAVPLVNDEIQLQDIFKDNKNTNTKILTDEQGKVTLVYQGEVLNDPASVVFPPFFGTLPIPFKDSVFQIDLSQGVTKNKIDSAVFKQDKFFFSYTSSSKEPIKIKLQIDEIKKDGKALTQEFLHPGSPDGTPVELEGPPINIKGYYMSKNDNKITFKYDARTPTNERIEIDRVKFRFNVIEFSYAQGYFPTSNKEITGNFIPINLYKRWLKGTLNFDDPKISIYTKNAFGFPVKAIFQKMNLETINGNVFDLEGDVITNGLNFNYPTINEIGQIKTTEFEFDKNNSNIQELFKDRIAKVNYQIDAIANPDNIDDLLGFIEDRSYYSVDLKVELPMNLSINDFQVVDTIPINSNLKNEHFDKVELKIILENNFPIDISTQLYLMDENKMIIDSIFDAEIMLKGGTYAGNSTLNNTSKEVIFFDLSDEKIKKLNTSKFILAKPTFHSTPDGKAFVQIYDSYGLKVKIGAKLSLK